MENSSGYRILSTRAIVWAAICLVVLGVGMAIWLLLAYGSGTDVDKVRLEAIKTAGTIVVGTGGAAALWLAARRQQTSERVADRQEWAAIKTEHDAAERRVTELYTKAVEQLGSDKAPVRLGGMYALERLAQNVPDQRQTIVNVLCAYLRMPYLPPPEEGEVDEPESEGRRQERQARITAQRILADHLRPGDRPGQPADTYWEGTDLDLTGAVLLDLDLSGCRIRTAQFNKARFRGHTRFREAQFDGDVWFDGAVFDGEATFNRTRCSGNARFGEVEFGKNAWFNGARFGQTAGFNEVKFMGDAWFRETKFDAAASFDWAVFNAEAWFNGAEFARSSGFTKTRFGPDAWFRETKFAGEAVFDGVEFGRAAMFGGAEFGGYAGFNEAEFGGAAWFDRASFGEGVWFRGTFFGAAITFESAVFGGAAWFDGTCFGGGACFRETQLRKAAAFEKARVRLDVHLPEESVWPPGAAVVDPAVDDEAGLPGRDGRWGHVQAGTGIMHKSTRPDVEIR